MTLLAIIGSYAALVSLIFIVGEKLDAWWDEESKAELGRRLAEGTQGSTSSWLQTLSRTFLQLFDRLYGGRGSLLEQLAWGGLLISPVTLIYIHPLVSQEISGLVTGHWLLLAIGLAFAISLLGLPIRHSRLGREYAEDSEKFWKIAYLILGIAAIGGVVTRSHLLTEPFWAGNPFLIFEAVFFGIVGLVLIILGVTVVPLRRVPVHPAKALASSIAFIFIVGLIQRDAGRSFFQEVDSTGFHVLGFVAFNIFADAFSLIETRWIIQRVVNARVRILLCLLAVDLALSAAIFLFLPLILGEVPAFLQGALFQGDHPWLGILFWTTFSTSIVFYVFVKAALLVQPLAGLANVFGWLSRPFNLETHPIRCIAVTMALVVTAIFVVGSAIYYSV